MENLEQKISEFNAKYKDYHLSVTENESFSLEIMTDIGFYQLIALIDKRGIFLMKPSYCDWSVWNDFIELERNRRNDS